MLGFLLLNKPVGATSHDVVNMVRRKFGTRKAGHAGTLDPMGSGLLVVAVGPATRFLQYLPLEPKEYQAEITFGWESTTQDSEGELINPSPVPEDLESRLREQAPRFTGLIEQLPPMHSAVKVSGRPLYMYAREGKEVERRLRKVFVENFEVVEVMPPIAKVHVVCSGGTYMRTLAHDVGRALGCGSYLSFLVRTRCGGMSLAEAKCVEEASDRDLLPLSEALKPMPMLILSAIEADAVRHGQRLGRARTPAAAVVALREGDGPVFGVARIEGNQIQPECVLPAECAHG